MCHIQTILYEFNIKRETISNYKKKMSFCVENFTNHTLLKSNFGFFYKISNIVLL